MAKADVIRKPRSEPSDNTPSLLGDYLHFLTAFARRPQTVGAVAPSSRALGESMCPENLDTCRVVVELGGGTGAVTRVIRRRLAPDASLIVLELNANAASLLQARFPDAHVIADTAENLRQHLDAQGHLYADCVISGLPWGSMPRALQFRLLDAVTGSLRPGGTFTAMAYLHASVFASSHRFKSQLHRRFASVTRTRVVWPNVPPAFVYHCKAGE